MPAIEINGRMSDFDVADDTPLLWVLRDVAGLTGTKYGCGVALCGFCTVHLDGEPIRSCQTAIRDVAGRKITTIEAIRVRPRAMCQYSAEKGCMNDWHLIDLGQLSVSGAALLTIEATADPPEGRTTWADVGLWNDETEAAPLFQANHDARWPSVAAQPAVRYSWVRLSEGV
jgi:hypothetical protein